VPWVIAGIVLAFTLGNYHLGFAKWKVHWWADTAWTLAALISAVKCVHTARSQQASLRKAWIYFGLGCWSWFVGMVIWDYLELVRHEITPFPALSDIGFLALSAFFMAGLFHFRFERPQAAVSLKQVCNLGIILAGMVICTSIILYAPLKHANATTLYSVTAIGYPVLYGAAFLFGLTTLWFHVWGVKRQVLMLLIAGLAIHALTNTLYAYSLLSRTYEAGGSLDAYWILGFGFFYWAAARQDEESTATMAAGSQVRRRERARELEMLVPAITLIGILLVTEIFRNTVDFEIFQYLFPAGLVLVGFMALREWWSYRIETDLYNEVRQSAATLRESMNEVEQSEARLAGILNIAKEAIISVDQSQRIIIFNKGAEEIFGYSAGETLGQSLDLLIPERLREAHRSHVAVFSASGVTSKPMGDLMEVFGLRKNGEEFPAEASISKLETDGDPVYTVVLRDITDRKRAQEALADQASRDPLTGLYNRRYFNYRIAEEIYRAERDGHCVAILICDLDHFKEINDTRGHLTGDKVLKTLGRSLQESIRGADTVFRWGGDEIVVMLSDTTREGILITADRIRNGVEKVAKQLDIRLDVSIGAAIYPEMCEDADELIRLADRALYIAKKGGDKIHIGEEEYALDENAVRVVFQPVVDVRNNEIVGYEALSRDPRDRMSTAELFHRYNAIGQLHELKCLCFRIQLDRARRHGLKKVFINVDSGMLGTLEPVSCPPDMEVILEFSEAEAVHDVRSHLRVAAKWRDRGFRFAIDDFGAGFVSLPFIAQLIPDYVKIDRSTILHAVSSEKFRRFLKDWIQALKNYSPGGIIAEGVENAKEMSVVREIGIHMAQGYLLGKPEELGEKIRKA
jgi:diguanylate cyclase (GGDEF)-like protein/PAS domain S-box-containing protein